jgi:uncharacterized protein YndB with AHSA1/START domain
MNQPLPISVAVDIAAPPQAVWSVVSDVTRMPEWSPECRRILPLGSQRSGTGTRFVGINRRGWAVWPTTSTVVRFETDRAVAWKTRQSAATWTYELEPTGAGTRLSARRDLDAYSPMTKAGAPLIGGAVGHDRELTEGLRTTLERIKAAVEAGAPAER